MPEQVETFGELLARLRTERGLTQEALGAKIGRTQSAIARLETGQGKYKFGPNGFTLCELAEALEVPMNILTGPLCADMRKKRAA